MSKIREQPELFLCNYLRKVTEWFGLSPVPGFSMAWKEYLRNNQDDVTLPDPIQKLVKKGVIRISNGLINLPAFLIVGLIIVSTTPNWDEVSKILHTLRHNLLRASSKKNLFEQRFQEITNYLENPATSFESKELEKKLARGELVDINKIDFIGEINQLVIDGILSALHKLYEDDQTRYRQVFGQIQSLLWDKIIKAHREITAIENTLPSDLSLTINSSDWLSSCREVSAIINSLSDAYAILSGFEETLGVDRYLGSKVISPDLDSIHNRIRVIGGRIQNLLINASGIFLRQ